MTDQQVNPDARAGTSASSMPGKIVIHANSLTNLHYSLHLPNPFKTWTDFYHQVLEQRGPDSVDEMISLTEVRATGAIEAGYTTHYSALRVYQLSYIAQQVFSEQEALKKQQTFTFHELQTILYALNQSSHNLDPSGMLKHKVENMRNSLVDEPRV